MVKYFFIFISIFFIFGCASSQKQLVKQTYPKWYSKTMIDSSRYYFASSEGITKHDAVVNALNEIASKISISISSKFESNVVLDNDIYNKSLAMDITNKIENIHFNNYKILKEQVFNDKHIVLLKVDKIKLKDELQTQIDDEFNTINHKLNIDYKNILLKIKNYNKILISLENLKKKIYIFSSIDKKSNIKKYLTNITKIKEKISLFKNSITFKIDTNNNYAKILKDFITDKGYKLVKYNSLITIKLSIKKQKINSFGYKILKGIASLKIVDNKTNSIVDEKRFIISGKSISDFAHADEFMLQSFKDKLKMIELFN